MTTRRGRWGARRRAALSVLAAAVLTIGMQAQTTTPPDPEDGLRLERKIAVIVSNGGTGRRSATPVTLHEREVNAYLRHQGAPALPTGVTDAEVDLEDGGVVAARAVVDLGAISGAGARGTLDPLRYLTGALPVFARGVLQAQDGRGRFEIESVTVGGVPVPVTVLRELVGYYSRTDEHPDGFDVTAPFDLPYGVTRITIERERAVVAQ